MAPTTPTGSCLVKQKLVPSEDRNAQNAVKFLLKHGQKRAPETAA